MSPRPVYQGPHAVSFRSLFAFFIKAEVMSLLHNISKRASRWTLAGLIRISSIGDGSRASFIYGRLKSFSPTFRFTANLGQYE